MEKYVFESSKWGIRRGVSWLIKKPKANIMIFEGMEEHASRYDKFALELNKAGYNVYSIDTFGQGENAEHDGVGIWPENGFIEQVDIYGEVAEELNKSGLPLYIFSHSMGSFMCQSFLIRHPSLASRFCICGSGGKNPILGMGHVIAKLVTTKKNRNDKAKLLNNLMFANLSKSVKNAKTEYDWLSYNEENVKTYIADPLCGFGPTNGFCLAFIEGMLTLYKKENLANVAKDISIFLIGGIDDPVTGFGRYPRELEEQYKELGVKEVSRKNYDHMRHEILNEDDWKTVSDDVINFFNK